MKKLPSKPSELLKVALADLEKIEGMPDKYVISFGSRWHSPCSTTDVCEVCFAGSVMAGTLVANPNNNIYPDYYDEKTTRKLKALNDFREGDVHGFLRIMEVEVPDSISMHSNDFYDMADEIDCDYEFEEMQSGETTESRELFKQFTQDWIGILQAEGL